MTKTPSSGTGLPWLNSKPTMAGMQDYLMAMPHLYAVGAKALLHRQKEMLSFMTARCEQQLRLLELISGAQEPKAVLDAMMSFDQASAKEYTSEVTKVVDMGASSASKAMSEIRAEAEIVAKAASETASRASAA